ncbi:MAG: HRDC domain-containing protein [Candidatus Competibacteraceae bacterium]|nr:HRDC domain-containing protein [Candidatus Competibacteraceae bacterium]
MHLRFFTIPIHGGDEAAAELNRFLGAHRILTIDRSLVQDGANSAWALCVSFEPAADRSQPGKRGGKIDYREVLNEQDFAVFARLRTLRKELADGEGIPAYAVLTNEQLAELVQRRVQSAAALREIAGVGDARVEKYGEAFLRLLRDAFAATGPTPPEPTGAA